MMRLYRLFNSQQVSPIAIIGVMVLLFSISNTYGEEESGEAKGPDIEGKIFMTAKAVCYNAGSPEKIEDEIEMKSTHCKVTTQKTDAGTLYKFDFISVETDRVYMEIQAYGAGTPGNYRLFNYEEREKFREKYPDTQTSATPANIASWGVKDGYGVSTRLGRDGGTLTITEVTDGRIAGRFEFAACTEVDQGPEFRRFSNPLYYKFTDGQFVAELVDE